MAKVRAEANTLGALHKLTAEYFSSMLEDAIDSGDSIPAAQMGNILRFLHDNDIVAESDTTNVLEEIKMKLEEQRNNTLSTKAPKILTYVPEDTPDDVLDAHLPDEVDYEELLHDVEV